MFGVTAGAEVQSPGMVTMSKLAGSSGTPVTFSQTDLFGSWRVYLHRVDSKQAGSTSQIERR